MTTEQQEFLEKLKNPTKALLNQAVQEFHQNHCNSIEIAHAYESYKNEYVVEVWADNHDILLATESILASTIKKYLNNPLINIRIHPDELPNGLYRRTYFVVEA